MTEPPNEREFGPPISRNRRLALGVGMIVVLVGLILLVVVSGTPSG